MSENQRVLIVDDEPRNQRIVAETLEGTVEIRIASSGEEALEAIASWNPDLVLLDLMMAGMDGYEVCRRIKSHPNFCLTKVILVSGKAMIEERLKGYDVGADDYMTKPFVPEELLAKAKVFLRLTRTEKQLAALNQSLEQIIDERTNQLISAESKLINSAKMSALGEMAGGIAHEINTPICTIGLMAEQIKDFAKEPNPDANSIIEMASTVESTIQHVGSIINGLRMFSRDGSRDHYGSASAKEIVESTLILCREKIKDSEIELIVDPISDDLNLYCQKVQISQALLNLISNAYDAVQSLEKKWIRINCDQEGGMVRIHVTDSGPGIPIATQYKIFQPFFTTKEIGKGTGLGLSISIGIMQSHHGRLNYDHSSPNTKFVLECPTPMDATAGLFEIAG